MRIQRFEPETPSTCSVLGMKVGEVYKHPELPDLYMKVEISGSTSYVINLGLGRRADLMTHYANGWIHCPNAVCKEED